MDADRILPVNREHLLLMQVLCWLAPGIKILGTGIKALLQVGTENPERIWWLALIAMAVTVAFSAMFHKFIIRYTERILGFTERKNPGLGTALSIAGIRYLASWSAHEVGFPPQGAYYNSNFTPATNPPA